MAGRYRGNGEGTISRPKDGRWVARYHGRTAGGPNRRAICAGSCSEAATKLARAIADRDGKGPITAEPSKLPVSEYLAEWLASKGPDLGSETQRRYASIVTSHLSPALGSLKLSELRRADVEYLGEYCVGYLLEHLLEHLVGGLRSAGMKPSTVRHIMAVLSCALNQEVTWELPVSNPATTVKRPKDRTAKMRVLSEEEAARLMEAAKGTRREVLYDVALTLGPREGELRALRWSDLDLSGAPTLAIERSVHADDGIERGPTKTGEERRVRVPDRLVEALRRHRKAQLEERAAAREWEDPSLLFPNIRGAIWRHQTMHDSFKLDLEAAGLPKTVRFDDLRHTAAALMLKKRVPVNVVSRVLGHCDPAMTLRRYARALPDMQELAAAAMESYDF